MAKKVIWSEAALGDKKEVLQYWIERNKSKTYSIKLDELFREAVQIISEFPMLGNPTSYPRVRAKVVRDYYIFYREKDKVIEILAIWDQRRNPEDLKDLIDD